MQKNLNQAKIVIFGNNLAQSYKLIKCVIPYYKELNEKLYVEIKEKLGNKQMSNKLEQKLNLETKYYQVGIEIYCYTYNDVIEDEDEVEQNIEKIKQNLESIDAIYFLSKIKNQNKIQGFDEFQEIVNHCIEKFQPQLQTLVFDVENDEDINDNFIQKTLEQQKYFIEPVYENIQKVAQQDIIVKEKSKSLYEDTEGITRIIEAMESTMWKGYLPPQKQNQRQKKEDKQVQKQNKDDNNQDSNEIKNEEKLEKKLQENDLQQKEQENKEEQNQQDKEVYQNNDIKQNLEKQEEKNEESDNNKNEVLQEKLNKQDKLDENENQAKLKNKKQTKKKEIPQSESEQQEDLGNFIALMGQMQNLRQNVQHMTDEERIKQASDVMLKLMGQCGFDDSDEEDILEDYIHGENKEQKKKEE